MKCPSFFDDVPMRTAVRVTQLAEQLVEVPTNPGYALAVVASKFCSRREIRGGQGSTASGAALIVDTPIPQVRRGGGGGLQGSRVGQNSTAADLEQIVDIPARTRGLQGIRPGQSSTASVGEQIVDIPVPHGRGGFCGGSLQEFSPGQGSRASSSRSRAVEVAFDGVFRTFPGVKKMRDPPASAEITR